MPATRPEIGPCWDVISQKPADRWNTADFECVWQWIETEYKRLLLYALRILRSVLADKATKEDAEEAVQNVLTYLFVSDHIRSFDPLSGNLSTYLHTCIRNECLHAAEKIGRRQETDLHVSTEAGDFEIELEDDNPDPEESAEVAEMCRIVEECINTLSRKVYRTVAVMRYLNDLDLPEIARRLNVSPGTVKVRLFRARQQLLVCLRGKVSRS
jgi:RNA polymerase sigma-70 factor, ECF subfamily